VTSGFPPIDKTLSMLLLEERIGESIYPNVAD
jgi:hypothetical protein